MPLVIALFMLFVFCLSGGYALSQDAEEESGQSPVAEAAGPDDTDSDDAGDGADDDALDEPPVIDLDDPDYADLDRQTYEEDDDDFVPTEEIPADEAIPFPSDI